MTDATSGDDDKHGSTLEGTRRAASRMRVKLVGRLRQQGRTALDIEIHDLSITGFQVDTVYRMAPGTLVWLQAGGLAPLPARVRWFRSYRIGCAFETPLHPSVLERIVAGATSES